MRLVRFVGSGLDSKSRSDYGASVSAWGAWYAQILNLAYP